MDIEKLFDLHDRIAAKFVSYCGDAKRAETYKHPANYRPNVVELKNIYMKDFNREELKGCCKFEPISRFLNIFSVFPYKQFTKNSDKIDALWEAALPSLLEKMDYNKFVNLIEETLELL